MGARISVFGAKEGFCAAHILREADTEIGAPVAYEDRRTCCGGVPRGGAGRRRGAFGHRSILLWLWEIKRSRSPEGFTFGGVCGGVGIGVLGARSLSAYTHSGMRPFCDDSYFFYNV